MRKYDCNKKASTQLATMNTIPEQERKYEHATKSNTTHVSEIQISHQDTPLCSVKSLPIGTKTFECIRVQHTANVDVDLGTQIDELWKMMETTWKLEKPHLLISVTGGAQNLSMSHGKHRIYPRKPALKFFHKGLAEAAQSTGAWIITGGTDTGVMKLVGDAIRAHTLKKESPKPLVAIGIATWGCIEESLPAEKTYKPSPPSTPGRYSKKKSVDETIQTTTASTSLNPDHTHFILVDDGTRDQYGAEIRLRAFLEEKISTIGAWGVKIPIVCIVVEGGPNTIKTVKEAIEANTPIIVIEGSGRAADVLAYAYNHYTEPTEDAKEQQSGSAEEANERLWKELEPKLKQSCGKKDLEEVLRNIKLCLKRRNMITVFPLEEKGSTGRIDHAIIMTLLRVKKDEMEVTVVDKMKLAMAWDRIDVVKEHIYTDDTKLTADELNELAFRALAYNRVDFVKFFLERGLRLNDLMKCRGNDVYTKTMKKNKHLEHALTDGRGQSRDHWKGISQNSSKTTHSSSSDHKLVATYMDRRDQLVKKLVKKLFDPTKLRVTMAKGSAEATDLTADVAAMELFFLAILCRWQSMAVLFLFEANETFALSLIGHLMLTNLLKMENDSESEQELQRQVDFFKDLTTGLLTECYSSNQERTIDLFVRPIHAIANRTALEIAVQANNESVIAHPACQELLTDIWMGRISDDNQFYKKLLGIPPLFLFAPLLVQFSEETSETKDGAAELKTQGNPTRAQEGQSLEAGEVADIRRDVQSNEVQRSFQYFRRLWYFLTAPCVKFSISCVSYAVFLLLYSVVLLTNFHPKISTEEIVLIVWVGTIVCDEIRQVAESRKLHNYLSSKWNWVDLAAISTFVLGLVLRLIPISSCDKCFYTARIILALSLMTFYFRILHMFSIFRQLGPKLVMIGKMIIDLTHFMNIFMVFIIAYGIAANVILYPNQELKPKLIMGVFNDAWWSVYGEFDIDQVSGEKCNRSASQTSSAEECASLDLADFNRTLCPGKEEMCPAIDWFGPIFLAIYALITNVLMINLLIAMFSNTFDRVEDAADVIWKIQRYQLVLDYDSLPILPPPLVIIPHLYHVIQGIIRKLRSDSQKKNGAGTYARKVENSKQSSKSSNRAFKMCFGDDHDKKLIAWLKVNVEEYQLKQENEDAAVDRQAKETNERIDQVLEKIGDSRLETVEELRKIETKGDQRMKAIEDQIKQLIELLSSSHENFSERL